MRSDLRIYAFNDTIGGLRRHIQIYMQRHIQIYMQTHTYAPYTV